MKHGKEKCTFAPALTLCQHSPSLSLVSPLSFLFICFAAPWIGLELSQCVFRWGRCRWHRRTLPDSRSCWLGKASQCTDCHCRRWCTSRDSRVESRILRSPSNTGCLHHSRDLAPPSPPIRIISWPTFTLYLSLSVWSVITAHKFTPEKRDNNYSPHHLIPTSTYNWPLFLLWVSVMYT